MAQGQAVICRFTLHATPFSFPQVKTNIEDFDMSPDEAVKSAADEFVLQGYDMGCVVKTSAGGDLSE